MGAAALSFDVSDVGVPIGQFSGSDVLKSNTVGIPLFR